MASSWQELTSGGVAMQTWVGIPEGQGPFPGVVVAQHAGGVDEFMRAMVDRLVEQGYIAVAPTLFHRQDGATQESLEAIPANAERLGKLMPFIQQLKDEEIVQDIKVSMDHLTAATFGNVAAAGVFYGGNIMTAMGSTTAPFDLTANIQCPVAGYFGGDDVNPSLDDVAKISAELDKFGKVHDFHSYPGAGHAFQDFTNQAMYREGAAKESWQELLTFFGKHLKSS
jgi:carboxymethylenebutenolidase